MRIPPIRQFFCWLDNNVGSLKLTAATLLALLCTLSGGSPTKILYYRLDNIFHTGGHLTLTTLYNIILPRAALRKIANYVAICRHYIPRCTLLADCGYTTTQLLRSLKEEALNIGWSLKTWRTLMMPAKTLRNIVETRAQSTAHHKSLTTTRQYYLIHDVANVPRYIYHTLLTLE